MFLLKMYAKTGESVENALEKRGQTHDRGILSRYQEDEQMGDG
jgi:hypothetical protein